MKIAVLFCILAAFLPSGQAQVLIRGHIKDDRHGQVTVFAPVNGFCNRILNRQEYRTVPGPDGYFEKHLAVDFPVMVTISVGIRPVWVFVAPGDTVTVDIDAGRFTPESPGGGILIQGTNGAGNTFYNTFNYSPGEKFNRFQRLLDSMHFRQTLDPRSVQDALSVITAPFESLLASQQITKAYYDIVVNDIRNVLITHLIRFVFDDKDVTNDQAISFFNKIYDRYPLTEAAIRGGLYGVSPCEEYYYIKGTGIYPGNQLSDSTLQVRGKTVFVNRNLVPYLYAPADLRETLWALKLISLKRLFASTYGRRDVDAFVTMFPDSRMKAYLAPPYFNLSEGPATFGDSSGYVFASNNINSFDALLAGYRGKRLLVDLWATWCVPCKLEFGYNAPIDSFCRRHDIRRLYIAFERGATRNNVKKDVYAYSLKGFHAIANDTLIRDMTRRIYPPNEGYVIPHYLLVDENGHILDAEAPRPSSGKELLLRMLTVFKLKN